MRHVFRATRIGYPRQQDGIFFDTEAYTKEQAQAEFKEYQATTQEGFPYKGYEYGGIKYHDVTYLGVYEDDRMPRSDSVF